MYERNRRSFHRNRGPVHTDEKRLIRVDVLLALQGAVNPFGDPLSLRQLVSWILLSASTAFVILGLLWLRSEGRPDPHRQDDQALLGIERTTRLVTTGIYKYVRHPLYSSLLLLAWGVFLKRPSWPAGGLALCASVFLVATAKVEEEENVKYFGEAYRTYMQKTQMFVPPRANLSIGSTN